MNKTFEADKFQWMIAAQPVKGHTPFSHQVQVRRNGELWATVKRKHDGGLKLIKALPSYHIPTKVSLEVANLLKEVTNG